MSFCDVELSWKIILYMVVFTADFLGCEKVILKWFYFTSPVVLKNLTLHWAIFIHSQWQVWTHNWVHLA